MLSQVQLKYNIWLGNEAVYSCSDPKKCLRWILKMQTTIDYLEGRPKRKMRLLLVKCDSSGVLVHLLRSCQKKKKQCRKWINRHNMDEFEEAAQGYKIALWLARNYWVDIFHLSTVHASWLDVHKRNICSRCPCCELRQNECTQAPVIPMKVRSAIWLDDVQMMQSTNRGPFGCQQHLFP